MLLVKELIDELSRQDQEAEIRLIEWGRDHDGRKTEFQREIYWVETRWPDDNSEYPKKCVVLCPSNFV